MRRRELLTQARDYLTLYGIFLPHHSFPPFKMLSPVFC